MGQFNQSLNWRVLEAASSYLDERFGDFIPFLADRIGLEM